MGGCGSRKKGAEDDDDETEDDGNIQAIATNKVTS
jgi:hypothetical protein